MARQKSPNPYLLPLMFADLAINSCDTIARRATLIMTGRCSEAEYRRMIIEKAETAQDSFLAMADASPFSAIEAAMTPWLRRAKANAQRLREAS